MEDCAKNADGDEQQHLAATAIIEAQESAKKLGLDLKAKREKRKET